MSGAIARAALSSSGSSSGFTRAQDLALDLLVRELQNLNDREFVFIEGYPRNLEELYSFQETVRLVCLNASH